MNGSKDEVRRMFESNENEWYINSLLNPTSPFCPG